MKVRFSSQKEKHPTTEGGLKVVYAPGKRMAFRLRWYLILLIVASPFIWFIFKLLAGFVLIEAPARTFQQVQDIRAQETGSVSAVHVQAGQRVTAGSALLTLENPALTELRQAIDASLQTFPLSTPPLQRQKAALLQQIQRTQEHVNELQRLVGLGAATNGELRLAKDQLNDREAALAALERSTELPAEQQAQQQRALHELIALDKRMQRLHITATAAGRIQSIEVNEGDSVGPGTLLMQVTATERTEIQVFLSPQQQHLSHPGQPLKLRLPDGQWVAAEIIESSRLVSRLPPDIRPVFGGNEQALLIKAEPLSPLPEAWQLDNLPLTARFPNRPHTWMQRLLSSSLFAGKAEDSQNY